MNRAYLEPGNGTIYDLIWGVVPGTTANFDNGEPEKFQISWMRNGGSGGTTMVVRNEPHLVHPSYVAEKMAVGYIDAKVISEFIHAELGFYPKQNLEEGVSNVSSDD